VNTHISRVMGELAAAQDLLTVYRLPAYASELDPVESVWSQLKRSLANQARPDCGACSTSPDSSTASSPGLDLTPPCNPSN
jgi:transposase